jgi:hypothetical protein
MHLEGSHTFRAPRQQVWSVLLDPAALAGCLPGCEGLTRVDADRYEAVLNIKVGPVTGSFKSEIRMIDIEEPERYRLLVEGSGGPGSMKGNGALELTESSEGTLVTYTGDVQVTGTIARVGQRLLPGVAKMMIGRFFECMDSKVSTASTGSVASA